MSVMSQEFVTDTTASISTKKSIARCETGNTAAVGAILDGFLHHAEIIKLEG
jgi:hypothetical protein